MFRLLVVTLVAIYAILQVFGDPDRRPEPVARASVLDVELIPAAYLPSADTPAASTYVSSITDSEAIQLALAAGAELRQARTAAALQGTAPAPVEADLAVVATDAQTVKTPELWNVIGTRVNLRSGPGTSNAIVGQMTQGSQAEMLAEADGWYQIRSADGAVSGWIFGKFLQPG